METEQLPISASAVTMIGAVITLVVREADRSGTWTSTDPHREQPLKEYVAQRVLAMLPVLLIVAVFTFSLVHIVPGDPAIILAGDSGTPETIADMRANLGLDKPIYQQFIVWLTDALQGDLGTSPASKVPVASQIMRRFEPTLSIGFLAMFLSIIVAVPLGVLAAWKQNTWIDRSSMIFAGSPSPSPCSGSSTT